MYKSEEAVRNETTNGIKCIVIPEVTQIYIILYIIAIQCCEEEIKLMYQIL